MNATLRFGTVLDFLAFCFEMTLTAHHHKYRATTYHPAEPFASLSNSPIDRRKQVHSIIFVSTSLPSSALSQSRLMFLSLSRKLAPSSRRAVTRPFQVLLSACKVELFQYRTFVYCHNRKLQGLLRIL
jgi:hypothetical protein